MDSLFGGGMAARFIIAFVVVLALIGISAWLLRRFGSGALKATAGRGRQPRLAVIDAATLDTRRRLVLVRRDNVEHLIMIGGPTDVVIEANIVRAAAPQRDTAPVRPAPLPEFMARPAAALDEGAIWPLQPQSEPELAPPRRTAVEQQAAPAQQSEDTARVKHRETLAELAEALAAHAPAATEPRSPEPSAPEVNPPAAEPAPQPQASEAKANLAEMAQRLEAALRSPRGPEPRLDLPRTERPVPEETSSPLEERAQQPAQDAAQEPASETKQQSAPEAKPEPTQEAQPIAAPTPVVPPEDDAAHPAESKGFYENLEKEMASLLGRPTDKT